MNGNAVIEILVNYGANEEIAKKYVNECEFSEGTGFWANNFSNAMEVIADFNLYNENGGLD